MSAAPSPRPASRGPLILALGVPLLIAFALWAFAWPAARTAPATCRWASRDRHAAERVADQLRQREGAFELHRYADEDRAREAIREREVYGAVVATPSGPATLTASAASPVVAQFLQQAAAKAAPHGTPPPTTDVVAAPPGDPRGAALSASVLPLAIAGVATGALVTILRLRGTRGVAGLLGTAALAGLVATAVADSWLGVLVEATGGRRPPRWG